MGSNKVATSRRSLLAKSKSVRTSREETNATTTTTVSTHMTRARTRPASERKHFGPTSQKPNLSPASEFSCRPIAPQPSLIVRLPIPHKLSRTVTPKPPRPQPPPLQDLWCARIVVGWDSGCEPAALCAKESYTQSKPRIPAVPLFSNEGNTFSPLTKEPVWVPPLPAKDSSEATMSLDASNLLTSSHSIPCNAPVSFPSPSHSEVPSLDSNFSSHSTSSSTLSLGTPPPPASNTLGSSMSASGILDNYVEWAQETGEPLKLEQDEKFWSMAQEEEEETNAIGWTW